MEKRHGLTLGKFAPFHKGHQLVIETALREMDKVSVIIYDAQDVTDIPLNVRSNWIKKLYPTVEVIEAWDGPPDVGNTSYIRSLQEEYILGKLGVSGITHFYSSEFYGDHMSKALKAENRLIDPDRSTLPVSGSVIREDPFANREFIHPYVYKDLISSVVFLGAPSTGKTTIAAELANEYDTVWMPEYGREYWEEHQKNRRLSLQQLVEIGEGHIAREDILIPQANRYMFIDTNAITTFMFSQYYHKKAAKRLIELALSAQSRYDIFFLCDVDIPYDDTWDRSGEVNRKVFQKQIIGNLLIRKIPFFLLQGDLQERIRQVKKILGRFKKYHPLSEMMRNTGKLICHSS
jgi:HTH-type transcriptional regulator, transcriptional repressor of NAD biosynthesis genes